MFAYYRLSNIFKKKEANTKNSYLISVLLKFLIFYTYSFKIKYEINSNKGV